MVPAGVRLECPECTWDCVMRSEQDVPNGVTKVVEGVPWCPNCNQPMKPVASVDVSPKPSVAWPDGLSAEGRLAKIREYSREVTLAERHWDKKKGEAKEAKENYDDQVTTLRTAIECLTGEPVTLPLFDQTAQAYEHPADLQQAHAALDQAVENQVEELRLRLAELGVCIDREDITGWPLGSYDSVVAWCRPESNRAILPPALEPHSNTPGWAISLKEKLERLEVPMPLSGRDGIFALRLEQRDDALTWANRELEEPGAVPRPSCLLPPVEQAPKPRKRKTGPQLVPPPVAADTPPADATAPAT